MGKYIFKTWAEVKLIVEWKYLLCFINTHTAFLLCTAYIIITLLSSWSVLVYQHTKMICGWWKKTSNLILGLIPFLLIKMETMYRLEASPILSGFGGKRCHFFFLSFYLRESDALFEFRIMNFEENHKRDINHKFQLNRPNRSVVYILVPGRQPKGNFRPA